LLEDRIEELGASHPMARHFRRELDEMEAYIKDRQENWRDTHLKAASEPSTRLVLVIEGVK
jgi:hypothetical protein